VEKSSGQGGAGRRDSAGEGGGRNEGDQRPQAVYAGEQQQGHRDDGGTNQGSNKCGTPPRPQAGGSRAVNVLPAREALSTVMSPPSMRQNFRLIARPSPVPPY